MPSVETSFASFIDFLISKDLIEKDGVADALSHLGGIDGIVAVGDYTLGYEGLAQAVTEQLSFEDLKKFVAQSDSILGADPSRRYYFFQSLLDNPALMRDEVAVLVSYAPEPYREFLSRRFLD